MADGHFVDLKVTVEDVLNCSYSKWYEKFKKYTVSEAVIFKPLPKEFIEYLEQDGIALPKENKKDSVLFQDAKPNSDNDYSDWEDDETESCKERNSKSDPTEKFKDFYDQLKQAFEKYGSLAPKLNWSAPQDSTWIMTGRNMKCSSPSDLFLLLKSSDYVNHDIYHAFDETVDYDENDPPKFDLELVLRKWVDINPSMEFRCFVRDRQLIAISQRDLNYYSFLEEIEEELSEKIFMFFDDVLLRKFDSNSFVFDVYIPKPFNKVYLIDINPFQRSTESFLFSWNELATMKPAEDDVDFRLITQHNSGRFATKAHSQNHVPVEFVNASVDTQSMIEFLRKCKNMEIKDGHYEDTDSEETEEEK